MKFFVETKQRVLISGGTYVLQAPTKFAGTCLSKKRVKGGLSGDSNGWLGAAWRMHRNEICIAVLYEGDCVLLLSRLLEVIILCKNTKYVCH